MKTLLAALAVPLLASAQPSNLAARLQSALGPDGSRPAMEAMQRHDYPRVEELLSRAAVSDSQQRTELMALSGAIAFLAGEWEKASSYFQQAAALKPLDESDAFTLAMADIRQGDGTSARSVLDGLAAKHPKSALYPYWLGRLDYDQRRYQEATIQLKHALALDPAAYRAWNALALCFDMQGQTAEALSAFSRAVALNRAQPQPSPWPPNDYGSLLLRRDRVTEAVELLREALRYDKRFAEAHYHLGRAYEKQQQDQFAITEYRAAMLFDPAAPETAYSLGQLEHKLGREAEAAAAFAEYRKRKAARLASEVR